MDFPQEYRELLQAEPWVAELADEAQRAKLAQFMAALIERNRHMNLTAIREPAAIARQHFADSLAPLKLLPWFADCHAGADIGSGAGFPVVPLAICMPPCAWTAIESIRKKADFLRDAAASLRLPNLAVENARAEAVAHGSRRGTFDVVTARAVGPFAALCEVGLPLLRPGGRLVLFKTEAAEQEVNSAQKVLAQLGGTLADRKPYRFADDRQARVLFVVERTGEVPASYPRDNAKPFKQPLA